MTRFGHRGPIGDRAGHSPGKQYARLHVIKAKDFGQTSQSDPVPLVWGTARRSGIFLFPVFNLRTKKMKQTQTK